jgi:hypothetical protein
MFGRQRRAAARLQAQHEVGAQAEADALFAEADRLDDLTAHRRAYRHQITAERAARIRAQLGEDLARDARGQISEPQLQGVDLEAEIDRLAALYPEYTTLEFVPWQDRLPPDGGRRAAGLQSAAHQIAADNLAAELWPERETADRRARAEAEADAGADPDYYRSVPGSAEHHEAYRQIFTAADGIGFAHPDPDLSYEIDNADELARERYDEELAERHYREVYGDWEAEQQADNEYEAEAEFRQTG